MGQMYVKRVTIVVPLIVAVSGCSRIVSLRLNSHPMPSCKLDSLPCKLSMSKRLQCSTSLASTFDPELINKAGEFLAEEAKIKSSVLLLAPTCNIQRNPLGGRAFESFSEDPHLSGIKFPRYEMSSYLRHAFRCHGRCLCEWVTIQGCVRRYIIRFPR